MAGAVNNKPGLIPATRNNESRISNDRHEDLRDKVPAARSSKFLPPRRRIVVSRVSRDYASPGNFRRSKFARECDRSSSGRRKKSQAVTALSEGSRAGKLSTK